MVPKIHDDGWEGEALVLASPDAGVIGMRGAGSALAMASAANPVTQILKLTCFSEAWSRISDTHASCDTSGRRYTV